MSVILVAILQLLSWRYKSDPMSFGSFRLTNDQAIFRRNTNKIYGAFNIFHQKYKNSATFPVQVHRSHGLMYLGLLVVELGTMPA